MNTPPDLRPSQPWYRRWWRITVHTIRGVVRLRDTPHRIATGVGCGLFSAVLPIFGQTIVGIVLTRILRGNIIASIPWSWISNPVTSPFIFYGCYRVGALLFPSHEVLAWERVEAMIRQFEGMSATDALGHAAEVFAGALLPLAIGSLVVGMLVGSLGYAATWATVHAVQTRRARAAT